MPTFDVAHIREQGVDLIIIPLKPAFGQKPLAEQRSLTADLQAAATSADLAGTVVPVWDAGAGRMGFLAPPKWRAFLSSIDLTFVAANINRKLTC